MAIVSVSDVSLWLFTVSICCVCSYHVQSNVYEFVMVNKSCQSEIDQEWRVILYTNVALLIQSIVSHC